MRFQLAQYSLKGSRLTNQDRIAYAERDNGVLMVLADGLGGYDGGALAAETLTRSIVRAFESVRQPLIDRPSAFLALAIMQAHKLILKSGRAHVPPISPRTTCVVCLVQRGYAYWAHVGDSRLYHFRGSSLVQRTFDHSTTEQMHLDGLLSDDEMGLHSEKGHLLKCVGGPRRPTVSLGTETALNSGDTLLLCSDGLWQALSPAQLAHFIEFSSLEEGIEEMLLAAENKMRKACDNLSAIGLRWEERLTRELPLQPVGVKETSHDAMWGDACRKSLDKKRRSGEAGTRSSAKDKSLDIAIKELEEFVSKFEPKRGRDR
ncbi:MAG: PP2C family protein-serine/threonine phosphatase [Acidiferrobacterales bacterium]